MKQIASLIFLSFLFSIAVNAQKVFIGSSFNDVGNEISFLLSDKYNMVEESSQMKDGVILRVYQQKVSIGKKQAPVVLSYTISAEGIVKKVEVKGSFNDVSNLYLDYWKTKTDYNPERSVVAERHFISDVIRLKSVPGNTDVLLSVTGS